MSDNKFSVDDILDEYSKKKENKPKQKSALNIDDFLVSTKKSPNTYDKSKKFEFDAKANNLQSEEIPQQNKAFTKTEIINKEIKEFSIDNNITSDNKVTFSKSENEITKDNQSVGNDESTKKELAKSDSLFSNTKLLKPPKKSTGNTEIIENILKMKREKILSKTAELVPINRKSINDIKLDITSKIIPKTEQISISDEISDAEKINLLSEKRSKKIRDFVLSSGEDDDEGEIDEDTYDDVEDFSTFEDAPAISGELSQLKGTLIIRFCFLLIATILSTYVIFANDFSWPIINILDHSKSPASFLFVNIVLGLLSVFVCGSVISNGLKSFFKFNSDADSLPAVAMISSLIPAVIMLFSNDLLQRSKLHIYIPIGIGCLLFNTIGKLLIVFRTERNFKFVSGDNEKYALFQIEDQETASKFTRGVLADFPSLTSMKKTEFVDGFLKSSFSSDISDSYCRFAVPIVFLSSLLIGIFSLLLNGSSDFTDKINFGLSAFAGTIALCSSFSIMLVVNLPFARSSKKYLQSSACMLGYDAVEEFSDTNSVLIDVNQLFPEGSVELVNLKQLSSASIEDGILVAASLACHSGSILKSTFYKMLKGKIEMLYPVDSYLYEDTLGVSGWIENKRVLLGTRELMINHSIEGMPSSAKEADYAKGNLVLYLAVSGEVTTMFIVKIKASHGVTRWLKELDKQNITVVLRSVDSIISLKFLSNIFGVSAERFKLIPFRNHKNYDEQTTYTPKISSSMVCSGKFQSFAMLIAGAKKLYLTSVLGITLIIISCVLGGILAFILTLLSSFSQLSASIVMLSNLVWVVIVYLFLSCRKS